MPLTSASLATGHDYLVSLRAAPGLGFHLQLIDRSAKTLAWKSALALRAESETYYLLVPVASVPPNNRLQISTSGGRDVEVLELSIQALHPAHSWLMPAGKLVGPTLLVLFLIRYRRSFILYLRSVASKGPAPVHEVKAWDRLIAVLVFVSCFQAFTAAPVTQLLDARYSTVVSHQIMTSGTLALPRGFSHAADDDLPYMLQRIDNSVLHFYPQVLALLNVPFVAAFELAGYEPVTADGFFLRHHENRILGSPRRFKPPLCVRCCLS